MQYYDPFECIKKITNDIVLDTQHGKEVKLPEMKKYLI